MSNGLRVEIEKTGFPVSFGEVKLWFDTSLENIKIFTNLEQSALKELKKLQKKFKEMGLPEKTEDLHNLKAEDADKVLDITKEFIAIQYDLVFGKGSFDKVYEVYPNMLALESALEEAGKHIAKEIEEVGATLKLKS